jgi:hypothetical protein
MSLYTKIIDQKVNLFSFTRVPENIPTPEVLISSLMRELKIQNIQTNEKNAWENSKKLKTLLETTNGSHAEIPFLKWSYIFENYTASIRSRDPNNKRSEYIYFNPIIPEFAKYGHAARFKGNPWNPGGMLVEEIYLGCKSENEWKAIELKLNKALSVDEEDDLWSRFIQNKTSELSELLTTIHDSTEHQEQTENYKFTPKFKERLSLLDTKPLINQTFVKQLNVLLDLKGKFSRHRWMSILQSYLRFGTFLLILNKLTYSVNFIDLLMNDSEYKEEEIFKATKVTIGDKRKELIEDRLVNYMYSNLQIALITDLDINTPTPEANIKDLFYQIKNKLINGETNFKEINKIAMNKLHGEYKEDFRLSQNDTIKNIREFLEYVGRDRSVNNKSINGDIGYIYTIPKNSKSYVVEFGLGLTYTLVLLAGQNAPSNNNTLTANEFMNFLKDFGLELTSMDFNEGPLRNSLNELGLLMESPDSELGVSIKKII